jgi:hypothetical protein
MASFSRRQVLAAFVSVAVVAPVSLNTSSLNGTDANLVAKFEAWCKAPRLFVVTAGQRG